MKTKHILTALALPAMFAACTADDIEGLNNGMQQAERPMLSEDFVLKVENGIESRYAVEGSTSLNFNFEEGDLIGANVIDAYTNRDGKDFDKEDPTTWAIVPYIAPALPFENVGGEWKSAGRVGMGNYLFTNPYNPEDEGRGAAKYELPVVVQYDSENPNAHIEKYNKAVAATVLYKADLSANISLKNLFTYPKIRINFDKDLEVKKVTKIILQKTDDEASFIYKGALNNKAIEYMFNPATLETEMKADKTLTEKSYWAEKTTSDFIIDTDDEKTWAGNSAELKTTPYFVYEMNETVKSNSIEVRFMLPSIADFTNPADDEKITMIVCTDAGNYEMELTDVNNYKFKETTLAAVKKNAFARNMSNTLTTKPIEDEYEGDLDADNIVSTAEDWNALVDKYGHLKKYSAEYKEDHLNKGDDDAEEMRVNVISDEFAFTSDLKMPEVAEFIIVSDIEVEGNVTLKNVKMEDATLTVKKDATLTTDPTLDAPEVEVEDGGELVFAAAYDEDEELVAYTKVEKVCNHGTVTVPAGVIAEFSLDNAKDAVLNVGAETRAAEAVEAVANLKGDNSGIINNYSVVNIIDDFVNNDPVAADGYEWDAEKQVWDGVPTINNNGTFNAKNKAVNHGLFNNNGVLTSSFVGEAYFNNLTDDADESANKYKATLVIGKNAKTYIDTNATGVIVLSDLNPTDFTIHNAKDASAYANSYCGTIKYTMNDKTANVVDLSTSPVTYLVTNVGIELTKTYNYLATGQTVATVKALPTLEVNGGKVKVSTTKNAATTPAYVAQVSKLIVNGEVNVDGEIASVASIVINPNAVLGVPAGNKLSISTLNSINTVAGNSELETETGKLAVNGKLHLTGETSASEVYGTVSGSNYTYDNKGKNIVLHKGVTISCAKTPAAKDEELHNSYSVADNNLYNSVINTTWYTNKTSNDTWDVTVTSALAMDSKYNVTVSGTTSEKSNEDYKAALTNAKFVTLMADLTGLKEGAAVTTLNELIVDGKVTISGSKNVNILKVKKLTVMNGSDLNIEGGYLVIDEVAVKGKGSEKIDIKGVYNNRIIAYNSDSEMLYWDNARSEWTNNSEFAQDFSEVDMTVTTAGELSQAVKNGVGNITLSETVELTDIWNVNSEMAIAMSESSLKGYINVASTGSLTLSGGTVNNENVDYSGITSNGSLVLDNVAVESVLHALRVESGDAEINSGEYTTVGATDKTTYALNVGDDGKSASVTINGGVFVGPADNSNSDSGSALGVKKGSTVVVNGGEFSKGKVATILCSGTLKINDAAVHGQVKVNGEGTVVIEDGEFFNETKDQYLLNKENSGSIVVNGGVFYSFNPAAAKVGSETKSYLGENCIVTVERMTADEWETVEKSDDGTIEFAKSAFDKEWSAKYRYIVSSK